MPWAPRELDNLISDPKDALDVFDFEPIARKNLPPAHFGYLATGIGCSAVAAAQGARAAVAPGRRPAAP